MRRKIPPNAYTAVSRKCCHAVRRLPVRKACPLMSAPLPLAGVKVVEICHSIAGPYAGSILAQLGADVVKVEHPTKGDDARKWAPPFLYGTSAIFQAMNRDKRGISVDMKSADECAELRRYIIEEVDVVVQSLRPGAVDKLGIDGAGLLAEKPSLVYCNLGAFGSVGPLKDKPGYDPLMQARSGLMSLTGEDGREPVRIGTSIIDMGTGMWVAVGVLSALVQRGVTGRGSLIDASLYETSLAWMNAHITGFLASGETRQRMGSGVAEIVPHQAFATSDGYIMVAAGNDNLFPRLAHILERPDWLQDERFLDNVARVKNRAALIPLIQNIFVTRPSETWLQMLDAGGVPASPLQTVDQVVNDPQTAALGIIQRVPDLEMQLLGLPLSFNGVRPPLRRRAPEPGEHNHQILKPHV